MRKACEWYLFKSWKVLCVLYSQWSYHLFVRLTCACVGLIMWWWDEEIELPAKEIEFFQLDCYSLVVRMTPTMAIGMSVKKVESFRKGREILWYMIVSNSIPLYHSHSYSTNKNLIHSDSCQKSLFQSIHIFPFSRCFCADIYNFSLYFNCLMLTLMGFSYNVFVFILTIFPSPLSYFELFKG